MSKVIPLTQGQFAIVSDKDFEWLSQWKWYAAWDSCTKSFYAVREVNGRPLRMHNAVWIHRHGTKPRGSQVDHANRITLDNRGSNLRLATRSQQAQNSGMRSSNTSGYRGVTWHCRVGKWEARIGVNGKRIHLGYFDDPADAARAYDAAALIYHDPEFAQLNFPPVPA
jgi:hypothetical protein